MAKNSTDFETAEGKAPSPPYNIPFRSFQTLLEKMESSGLPQRIDRSIWGTFMAGGNGPYLMSALRFLGLIDEMDRPTPQLESMVLGRDSRKELLAATIRERYSRLLAEVDLPRATPDLLAEKFREVYKLDGNSRRKATTFFIHAAQFAEMPLSGHLTRTTRRRRLVPKAGKAGRPRAHVEPPPPLPPARSPGGGLSRTIVFPGGAGQVTLHVDVDLFEVDEDQRHFYNDLVDRFKLYERDHPSGAPAGAQSSGDEEVGPA